MRTLGIGEIFRKISEAETKEERVAVMRKHWHPAIDKFSYFALDPSVVWDLPEGEPPFKVNVYLDQENNLMHEVRRIPLFQLRPNDNVPQVRKQTLFIQLLENMSSDDAESLLAMKDKTLPFGINPALIWEFWGEPSGGVVAPTAPEIPLVEAQQVIPLRKKKA